MFIPSKIKGLYKLYLDETGVPHHLVNQPAYFPYFILCGVLVNTFQSEYLKVIADRVKFKYWGETNIVFHSKEIGKREGAFSILRNPTVEADFHQDLVNFLTKNDVKVIIVAVNKHQAQSLGWSGDDVYKICANEMIKFFIKFLNKKKSRGQIIIESAGTAKEITFLKKYSYYLSHGFSPLSLTQADIKHILTSISFVSKRNFDIETQFADLLAYPAGYQCLCDDGKKAIIPNSYEDKMCKVLQQKIIQINGESSFIKLP